MVLVGGYVCALAAQNKRQPNKNGAYGKVNVFKAFCHADSLRKIFMASQGGSFS